LRKRNRKGKRGGFKIWGKDRGVFNARSKRKAREKAKSTFLKGRE